MHILAVLGGSAEVLRVFVQTAGGGRSLAFYCEFSGILARVGICGLVTLGVRLVVCRDRSGDNDSDSDTSPEGAHVADWP